MVPFLCFFAVGAGLWIAAVRPAWRPASLAASLAAAAVLAWRCGFVPEDSFISFRYARNLAEGNGLVYNPGERVEGYTNFLWTLWMALVHVLGLPVLDTAIVSSVLCHLATIAIVHRIPVAQGAAPRLPLAAALLAVSVPACFAASSGLETSLFAALVTAAVALQTNALRRNEPRLAALSAVPLALAALTRPEGAMIAFVSLGACGARTVRDAAWRRALLRATVGVGVVVAAHVAWRRAYYGDWLPNTFYCKVGYTTQQVERGAVQAVEFVRSTGGVVYLPAVVAMLRLRRRPWLAPAAATLVAMACYVVLIGGDNFWRFRYFVPVVPCLLLLVEEGVADVAAAAASDWKPWARGATALAAFAMLWAATPGLTASRKTGEYRRAFVQESSKATGDWVREHSPPGASIAVLAAGAMPYYARLPVIDMYGLNDRHIARSTPALPLGSRNAGHEKFDFEYVLSRKPTYIFEIGNGKFDGDDVISETFKARPELLRRLRDEYLFEDVRDGAVSFSWWRRREP